MELTTYAQIHCQVICDRANSEIGACRCAEQVFNHIFLARSLSS